MNYYNISLIGSPLELFTYHSLDTLDVGTKVDINVKNRGLSGVVIESCLQPKFETNEILKVSEFFYSSKQIQLARFISSYYISSL